MLNRFVLAAAALLVSWACGDSGGPVLMPTTITTTQPAPDSCTLGVPTELNALVTDLNGSPVPGVVVTFTVEIGAGTFSPSTSTTDANGIAATVFTCAPPPANGHPTIIGASFEGVQQNGARWALVVRAGALDLVDFFVFTRPDSIPVAAGFTQPLTLHGLLRDRFGGSPPATVTWEVVSGGGSLTHHSTVPLDCSGLRAAAGLARAWCVTNTWRLGAMEPGVQAIRLSSSDSPGFEQRFHVRVVPGPFTLIREPPSDLTGQVGSMLPTPFAVRVLAGDGSPIPRVVVGFFARYGELDPINPADTVRNFFHVYTDVNGHAAMRHTLPTRTEGYTIQASPYIIAEDGEGRSAGWHISPMPGPPVQLRISQGNNQSGSVGQPLGEPLGVSLADQFGNLVVVESVTWAVTSGGGSLAELTTGSDEIGTHQNLWTLGPIPGVQSATASFGGMTVTFTAYAGSGS